MVQSYKLLLRPLLVARLEYEKKRDVGSRIAKLESTIANLKNALKDVEKKQNELKSAMETANAEIEDLNEEVQGILRFSFYCLFCFLFG